MANTEGNTDPNTDESTQEARGEKIVMQHVKYSMVAGAIPFPLVDIAAVTAIQVDMIRKLAALYKVDFTQERGKSLASSVIGATVGDVLGRAGASMLKFIPGIGTILGVGSQVIFAGATTYALGKVFETHFEDHGTLSDVNMNELKSQFKAFFNKGKDIAKNLRGKQNRAEVLETIEKLKELKDNGAITEEEFESSKKELLSKIAE